MTRLGAAKFKATCLAVLDDVQASGKPVLITKNGKPVAKVIPVEEMSDPLAIFRTGSFGPCDDLDASPVVPSSEWKAIA